MTPKPLPVLQQCIEHGIELGWNRAHKHQDNPDPEHIKEQIYEEIMNEIHEWFVWPDMANN